MAYCKIHLYAGLLESDLPEDPYLAHDLERYFPPPLPERYSEQMRSHRLRREIIATVVANQIIDRAGTTFEFRLGEETGAQPSQLARAYAVAREVFEMRSYWDAIEALDNKIAAQVQLQMLIEGRRLVERATRWLVRSNPGGIDIAVTSRYFAPGARQLARALPEVLEGTDREWFDKQAAKLIEDGVPPELAERAASMPSLLAVLDVVEIASSTGRPVDVVTEAYFHVGSQLVLAWLRDRIIELPRANRWQALARAALRDDLYSLHRALTHEILEVGGPDADATAAVEAWRERNRDAVERALGMLADIKASQSYDTTTLPVALREVRNLIRGGAVSAGVPGAESVTFAG
jgi:glutamate dehydrogenase